MKLLKNAYLNLFTSRDLIIFVILIVLVLVMQYDLLRPAFQIGFTPDDWSFVFWYKLLGPSPLTKFFDVWSTRGPYTTVPIYYTGIIQGLVGFDFQKIQLIGIFFKILATLVLFPLTLLIFRNRLLAFLTVIFFAMCYPSSGALETVVEPSEYLGMFSMGLFFIFYYLNVKEETFSFQRIIPVVVLFIVTILLSVMRVYPLVVLVILIELYIMIQSKSAKLIHVSTLRLIFLYSPIMFVFLYQQSLVLYYFSAALQIPGKIFEGNWHLVLVPVQGIGHTIPINPDWWRFLGLLSTKNFNEYFSFVLGGPLVFFCLLTIILALFTVSNKKRFIILVLSMNFILEFILFFVATHYLILQDNLRIDFDTQKIYPTVLGIFILVLGFVYWIEWNLEGKKNSILLALWVGPFTAFVFTVLTWLLANINLAFGQGAHDHYLMIPSAGISIFLGAILTSIYIRVKKVKHRMIQSMMFGLIIIILLIFYFSNKSLIHSYFNRVNSNGRTADGQQLIQSKFREKIKDIDLDKPALFYFDTSEIIGDGPFYTEALLSSLPFFMHFQGDNLIDGCVEVYYESIDKLSLLINYQNGEGGFLYRSLCAKNGVGGYESIHYKIDNFYAFKIKNKDFMDIKKEILLKLEMVYE